MANLKLMEAEIDLCGYSKRTKEAYVYHVEKFLQYIKKKPQKVTRNDIKLYLRYLIGRENKERTINLVISALKFYFQNIMHRKIFFNIKRLKIPRNIPVVLSKEEVRSMILNTRNIKHRLLIELLYSSGLRVSEAVSLKLIDMDFNENFAIIRGKGKKERYVILSKKFVIDLEVYLNQRKKDNIYLFDTKKGHYCIGTAQKIVKQSAKRAGIRKNVFCHALRSSFATHLIGNKTEEAIVQRLLGHSRRETTRCYIKSSINYLKDVTSPLDLI